MASSSLTRTPSKRRDLKLAAYTENPLENESLNNFQLFEVEITRLTREAVKEHGLSQKQAEPLPQLFCHGPDYWLFERDMQPTLDFIEAKFGAKPEVAEANRGALSAGWELRRDDRRVCQHLPRRTKRSSSRGLTAT